MLFSKMSGWTLFLASLSANAQSLSLKCMVGFNINRAGGGLSGSGSSPITPFSVASEKECELKAIDYFKANSPGACKEISQGLPVGSPVSVTGLVRMTLDQGAEIKVANVEGSCPTNLSIAMIPRNPPIVPPTIPPIVPPTISLPERVNALEANDKKQNLQIADLNSTISSLRNQVGTQQLLIDSLTKRMVEVEKRLGIGAQQSFLINSPSIGTLDSQRLYFKGMVDNSTVAYVEMTYAENPAVFKQCSEALRAQTINRSAIKVVGDVVNKVQSGTMLQIYIKKVASCALASNLGEVVNLLAGSIAVNLDPANIYVIKGYDKNGPVYVNPMAGTSVYVQCVKVAQSAMSLKKGVMVRGVSTMSGSTKVFKEISSCELVENIAY